MSRLSLQKLLFASFIPGLIGLLALGFVSAGRSFDDYQKLAGARALASLVNATARLTVTDCPGEGVTSIAFSSIGDEAHRGELLAARTELDHGLNVFKDAAAQASLADPEARADVAFIIDRLNNIGPLRAAVDARRVTAADVVGFLQPTSPRAFDLLKRIGSQAKNAEIAQLVDGFHALLELTDGTHMENGSALQALGSGKLQSADAEAFFIGVQLQDVFAPSIANAAPPAIGEAVANEIKARAADFALMRTAVRSIVNQASSPSPDMPKWAGLVQAREIALQKLISRYQEQLSTMIDNLVEAAWRSFLTFLVATLGVIVVASVLSAATSRFVSGLLTRLSRAMTKLAGGDLTVDVAGAERGDEIGDMARSVEFFRHTAIANRRLEEESEQNRRNAEQARIEMEAQAEAAAQERVMLAMKTLAAGLKKLATGDLLCEVHGQLDPRFEGLRQDFNLSVQQLRGALQSVGTSVTIVDGGSGEISGASTHLARRTEQQAASVEETAATLAEITTTLISNSERTSETRALVLSAKERADWSGGIVRSAMSAMERIEKSSGQIGQIISVIDEIAFQTNLLALNAGVEAARAGEKGKGFAVVAQEVRALAQRSAEAAKQIKALISNSVSAVAEGVRLVTDTGQGLSDIETLVETISQRMQAIESTSTDQSRRLKVVNSSVGDMDQATQQNAAAAEEMNAASVELATESTRLRNLLARFTLENDKASRHGARSAGWGAAA